MIVSVLLRLLLPPAALEVYYSRGAFLVVREVWDATLGRLPLPLFYLFWIGVAVWAGGLAVRFRSHRRLHRQKGRRFALSALGYRVLNGLLLIMLAFLWLWGFNYGRVDVEEQLAFTTYEPELDELRQRVFRTAEELSGLRAAISRDTQALDAAAFPADLESAVRPLLTAALLRHDYPAPGRPRGWELLPRGVLLRLSTAGVYWPWVAQGNIDAGLHPLQKPAVMAHELAHAYGFGDEGTCSFWAYLTARETDDALLRYALKLAYWRHLAGLLRYADPERYLEWRSTELDAGIRNDLQAIYDNGEQYQDIAPALRDATYTAYLKAQGIHEGLLNYGRVVQLVEGYRRAFSQE